MLINTNYIQSYYTAQQDTKKILSETPEGKGIIQAIEKSGFMTKRVRHQLVRILVSYLISHHGKSKYISRSVSYQHLDIINEDVNNTTLMFIQKKNK